MTKDKNWIQKAIKPSAKGSLTKTAKKAGAEKKGGGIKTAWLDKEAKKDTKTGARARLSKTLKSFKKK
jgi:hypothetical protein